MTTSEKKERVHIDDLHFEHERWRKELEFYKDELPVFQRRLEEIAKRYTNKEVLAELDHFANQFKIQHTAIDELAHDIHEHERGLAKYAEDHPIAIDHVLFEDHGPIRERMETARKIFTDLKQEYNRYLAKWM